jgi:hypothetical protein
MLKNIAPAIERKTVAVTANSSIIGEIARIMPRIGKDEVSIGIGARGKISFSLPLDKYALFVANLVCGDRAKREIAATLSVLKGFTAEVVRKCVEVSARAGALDSLFEAIAKSLPKDTGSVTMSTCGKGGASFRLSIEEYTLMVANLVCSAQQKAQPPVPDSQQEPAGTGWRRFRSLVDDQIIEGPLLGVNINRPIAAIKNVKKAGVSHGNEIESQLHAAVLALAARAFPLANKRKSARLMKNLSAQDLMGLIRGLCSENGVSCGRFSEPKDMPKNLYFDRELLGGIVKVFVLKAIQNIKAGKADVKEVCGSIALKEDEPTKVIIVIRGISNGVHMQENGAFVRRPSKSRKLGKVVKVMASNVSTHGPLGENEVEVFNKALELLGVERSPIGNDGVKLIVPGSEWNPGRKPKSDKPQPGA